MSKPPLLLFPAFSIYELRELRIRGWPVASQKPKLHERRTEQLNDVIQHSKTDLLYNSEGDTIFRMKFNRYSPSWKLLRDRSLLLIIKGRLWRMVYLFLFSGHVLLK